MSTAHTKVDRLAERAQRAVEFGDDEIRKDVEEFTDADLQQLLTRRELVRTLVGHVQELQKDMNKELVDREEAVELALASFLAQVNMVFLGPPGTAKSLVVRRLSYGLGLQNRPTTIADLNQKIVGLLQADEQGGKNPALLPGGVPQLGDQRTYYEVLLTRYSTSDEILGPANLHLMVRHAMFFRQTTGLLPEAEVAFLDEIWKANSAILNALLSISNEKIFYNAGQPVRVPLCMIYGASNEVPREEELGAMYDRFPVRVICRPVDNSWDLLQKSAAQAHRGLFTGGDGQAARAIPRRATVNHFRLLYRALYVYFGPDSRLDAKGPFAKAFCETFDCLKREFQISDRSLHALYRLALALALLRGRDHPEAKELDAFKYCFHEPETEAALRDAVDQRISRYGRLA